MKTTVVVVIVGLLCCLAVSTVLAQSDTDTGSQIKQLQQDAINAQMKDDVSWAQQHLADGYVQGNSWGAWQTKDEVIKDYQNKTTKWKSGDLSDLQVATYGPNTAVSRYKFTYDATFNGTHRARSVLCSDTWVNESGSWKSVATHCSVANGQ